VTGEARGLAMHQHSFSFIQGAFPMAAKTGIPTILEIMVRLCDLLRRFEPILRQLTDDKEALSAVIATIMTACEALRVILLPLREFGD
jgi:hypothetical protein